MSPRGRRRLLGVVIAVLVVSMLGLGRWQLGRAQLKQAQREAAAQVAKMREGVALPQALAVDDTRLAWFAGSGRFEPPVIVLDNQQHAGRAGIRVYLPMNFGDHMPRLLVDLGWREWLPGRVLPEIAIPPGEVAVAGLLAPAPSVGIRLGALPAPIVSPLLLTRLDPHELAPALGVALASRVLRLDPALVLGYERDLDALPNTLPPERHRGYAVQWFALAGALTLLSLRALFRKGKS